MLQRADFLFQSIQLVLGLLLLSLNTRHFFAGCGNFLIQRLDFLTKLRLGLLSGAQMGLNLAQIFMQVFQLFTVILDFFLK